MTGARLTRVWLCFVACLAMGSAGFPAGRAQNRVTLAAVGDVFFARGVGKQIAKHGADWLFSGTRDVLKSADISFCNLECPLSMRGLPQKRRFLFRSDPKFAGTLRSNGFTVVSLANNHVLDYGRDAMLDTIEAVKTAGLVSVGSGKNEQEAEQLRVVRVKGLRVGFVAYLDMATVGVVRLRDRPTVAGVDSESLGRQIRLAKSRCDVLVVSMHWGCEYMKRPTERQRMLAHLCIDNGADLVLGHHPHVLQPMEIYKGKPIAYSPGAFVWDSSVFGADRTVIDVFELGKASARLARTVPIRITACRPARRL